MEELPEDLQATVALAVAAAEGSAEMEVTPAAVLVGVGSEAATAVAGSVAKQVLEVAVAQGGAGSLVAWSAGLRILRLIHPWQRLPW